MKCCDKASFTHQDSSRVEIRISLLQPKKFYNVDHRALILGAIVWAISVGQFSGLFSGNSFQIVKYRRRDIKQNDT
jgi:hypothetical protein